MPFIFCTMPGKIRVSIRNISLRLWWWLLNCYSTVKQSKKKTFWAKERFRSMRLERACLCVCVLFYVYFFNSIPFHLMILFIFISKWNVRVTISFRANELSPCKENAADMSHKSSISDRGKRQPTSSTSGNSSASSALDRLRYNLSPVTSYYKPLMKSFTRRDESPSSKVSRNIDFTVDFLRIDTSRLNMFAFNPIKFALFFFSIILFIPFLKITRFYFHLSLFFFLKKIE